MTDVRAKLAELGLTLPVAAKPVAAYVPAIRTGNIVFTAGQLPLVDGIMAATGKVGKDVNVEANDLQDKVSVFSFALSDTIGTQNFYQSNFKDNDGMASLSSPLAQSNKSQVDVITLDSFWLEYVKSNFSPESEPIILIKLDIEGGEFRALQGAKRFINEIRPFILCEINSTFLEYASQIDGTTLIKFLVDLDYDVLYISETRGLEFVTSAHDLPHELTFGKEHGGNYLFIPRTSTFDSQFWLRTPLTYFAFKTLVMNRVKNLFDQIFRNRN